MIHMHGLYHGDLSIGGNGIDMVTLATAVLGGFFMGTYPVPIKAKSIIDAKVHPLVFQWYKSSAVFIVGWLMVIVNHYRGHTPAFEFTWWAFASTAAWIPGGLALIASVPRIGVSMAMAISAGTGTLLSFLVFWLALGEHMKLHGPKEHPYYLAPVYLLGLVIGMACLVSAPVMTWPFKSAAGKALTQDKVKDAECIRSKDASASSADDEERQTLLHETCMDAIKSNAYHHAYNQERVVRRKRARDPLIPDWLVSRWGAGISLAAMSGVLSAIQYGTVTVGRQASARIAGCEGNAAACPLEIVERFNIFGSWLASVGTSALFLTGLVHICTSGKGEKGLSIMKFDVTLVPGTIAASCWIAGALLQTVAVLQSGNAVMMPLIYASQLITSGMWGLLYYKEVRDTWRIVGWSIAAAWTLAFMMLLGKEKAAG